MFIYICDVIKINDPTSMGYEVRLYIGSPSSITEEESTYYFQTYATFDLCKIGEGYLSDLISYIHGSDQTPRLEEVIKSALNAGIGLSNLGKDVFLNPNVSLTKVYIYSGDVKTRKDLYGEVLRSVPIEIVYACLKKDMIGNDYRRFVSVEALLRTLLDKAVWEDVEIVMYGH